MPNSWNELPRLGSTTYVLPADAPYIDAFNKSAAPEHALVTTKIPEPWLGPAKNACLFVLQLNPRYLPTDSLALEKHAVIGSLTAPHYGLTSRDKWWMSCFKALALDVGCSLVPNSPPENQLAAGYKHLETRVCSVEYFPYGSDKYAHSLLRLPSQEYSFDLVRSGIERGACIAVMKGAKNWVGAVPQMAGYKNMVTVKGFRGAKYITPNSCDPAFYAYMVKTLLNSEQ